MTKLAHFLPIQMNNSLDQLAQLYVDKIVRLHGVPASTFSNRDSRFTSHFWGGVHMALGARLDFSTAFHLQTDVISQECIDPL